ncbi:MAG: dipeptide ABC transporter permease DppC, partial [Phototrophicales bacterium]
SWLDTLIMSFLELLNALPSLVLAIAIVAIVGVGLTNTVLAVALVAIPNIALQVRADIKAEFNKPYTSFARLDGANNLQIVTREVLPNVGAKLLAQSGSVCSVAILEISALGFLGLGAQAPLPEWGTLLSEAHLQFFTNASSIFIPGAAILLSVMSINWISLGLNDAINALKET